MSNYNIKNVGDKFIVIKNNVKLVSDSASNKITEFSSIDDANKYMEILQKLDKKKEKA